MSINPFPQAPFVATGPHFVSPEMLSALPGEWRYPSDLSERLHTAARIRATAEDWEALRQQGYQFIPGPPHPTALYHLMERFSNHFTSTPEQAAIIHSLLSRQSSVRALATGPNWIITRSAVTTSTMRDFGNARALQHNHVRTPRAAEVVWVAVLMRLLGRRNFLHNQATFTSDVIGDDRHLIVGVGEDGGISLRVTGTRKQAPDVGVLLVHDASSKTLHLTT